MKLIIDFLPIVLFFIAYKVYDIYVATAVLAIASILQVSWQWWRHGRAETLLLASTGVILVFAAATLLLHDETFIKWKPTVFNGLIGIAFLATHWIGKRTAVEFMMSQAQLDLPKPIWTRLNFSWVVFFFSCAVLNLYVAYGFDTDTWMNFKLFGLLGLTIVFMIGQGFYLRRHLQPVKTEE